MVANLSKKRLAQIMFSNQTSTTHFIPVKCQRHISNSKINPNLIDGLQPLCLGCAPISKQNLFHKRQQGIIV